MTTKTLHYDVKGSGNSSYKVTIAYKTGHWCTCRGMISKKKLYGEDAGFTKGTSCKHIAKIIDREFGGDWGIKVMAGSNARRPNQPVVSSSLSSKPSGRRAAIEATKAKREFRKDTEENSSQEESLLDKIASLESSR